MTAKRIVLHALISAVLAAIAGVIYKQVYITAFDLHFDSVLNTGGIIGASAFACALMATGYFIGYKWRGEKIFGWLNVVYSLLSFVSILGVLAFQLPMEIDSPELFPGLAIPMHFFPVLSFLVVSPFFKL